ncbi:MAG: sulfotransferase family protein [Myxococcota bacterium]
MSDQIIRIRDLAKPELGDAHRAALAYGDSLELDLSVDAVLEAAAQQTGFEDFGPDDFRGRLALWLSEVDQDPERTNLGRLMLFNDCVRYAGNRLRINALLAEHPEIHDIEIRQPIIVVGLPRSGTTHLVNLIAADSRLRSMPLWEGQAPVAEDNPTRGSDDPRFARCQQAWEQMQAMSPLIAALHPMNPDHIHEELELMLPDFSSYNQEWVARVPKWVEYYHAHDQRPHYEYMKTGLKILQWYMPRDRWVLKCPQHLEQLGPLTETFPDATFAVTHRDPVAVVQSAATITCYGARMSYKTTQPEWYLDYWTRRIGELLSASIRDRHLLPPERTIDVLFHEFMADDFAMVERIYEVAGLPMTEAARREIQAHAAGHRRGKHGKVVYDLREDFGAEPSGVRDAFGEYLERFPIETEVQ